jgi:uncharacterized protein
MPASTLPARTQQALARGIALFDAHRFWEAHEAWEEAWMDEEGDARVLLQGLIQVAAGYYKATVQNQPNGSVKLLGSGLAKLRLVPRGLGAIALPAFMREVERTLEEARRWQSGGERIDPAGIPRLG